ncbi:hypothetical protein ACP3V5_17590 [Vibrio maritimus]
MMASNTISLSEQALSQRLMRDTLNHTATLSGMVLSVCFIAGATLFFDSDGFLLLTLGAVVSALGSLAFILYRTVIGRHQYLMEMTHEIHAEARAAREQRWKSISVDLEEMGDELALTQLSKLKEKFDAFNRILDMQFDRNELAYRRYMITAEQLYFGAVDNVRCYMMLGHGISAIDSEHIVRQLSDPSLSEQAKQSLQDRQSIVDNTSEKMSSVLSVNEEIMTKLDDVTHTLSAIRTHEGLSNVRLETAMSEIQTLIERAHKYDSSH